MALLHLKNTLCVLRWVYQAIRDRLKFKSLLNLKVCYGAGSPEKKFISPLCSQGRTYGPRAKGEVTLKETLSAEVGGIGQQGALILTDLNHGFHSGQSCETQLVITLQDLCKNYDNGKQTDILKAFDTVPHTRLLNKIHSYGITGNLHRWLTVTAFLITWRMRVVVDGCSVSRGKCQLTPE